LKIKQSTGYALHIICEVAQNAGIINARQVSERTGITGPFTGRLLRELALAGFLNVSQGANGGYHLAMSPDDISLYDIIDRMEGLDLLTKIDETNSSSDRALTEIEIAQDRMTEHLKSVSIAAVIGETAQRPDRKTRRRRPASVSMYDAMLH